ncbi:hypothetical protein GGP41_000803 [Bipolaris sorokiniana]|uniref:Uncharacterized protein n=2 Tax=Cochliobolus sativus TaxID=45130 RepID=A0A8H5ZMQ6_COCSA|nr:hypothetical protein GGP41_000803 [Bipolaris sorokiniana]
METITNLASTATTAASKLIYGDQTQNNETAGKEPISGEKGSGTAIDPYDKGNAATADKNDYLDSSKNETARKEPVSGSLGNGTVSEPFDQGNDAKATENAAEKTSGSDAFLKLDPVHQTQAETSTSAPTVDSASKNDTSNVGMPITSLAPDTAVLSNNPKPSATETTGITDKVWKDTPLDDISRSGAPGAGPTAPSHVTPATPGLDANTATTISSDAAIKTSAPDSVTASSGLYSGSEPQRSETDAGLNKTEAEKEAEKRDTPAWTNTGVTSDSSKYEEDVTKQNAASPKESKSTLTQKAMHILSGADGMAGVAETETGRKLSSDSHEEKGGKMSHLKEKMKNKLHIGSKDK